MAVIPSVDISWKGTYRSKGIPMGLRNLGNTCYLNSVLQCLTYTPPLANLCLQNQHSRQCITDSTVVCPFCLLEKRIFFSLTNEAPVGSPATIYQCLVAYAKNFRMGRQEDAHEFLRYAIDACDNVCIRLSKKVCKDNDKAEVRTAMREIFGGLIRSQIRCLSCNGQSNKLDTIMDLSLDIMHSKSLKEAMSKFFQSEVLDGNNKYQCGKCKKLSVARKQMSVRQAPNTLVIQLKRFENFFGGKIDRHIAFEEKLTLAPYMSENCKDTRPDYQLYAVVVHSGFSQYGGHYYAYVKDPRGKWYCCNDSSVLAASSSTVLAEKVYMLFYLRCHPRPTLVRAPRSASSTPSPPTTPDPVCGSKPLSCTEATNMPTDREQFNISKPSANGCAASKLGTAADIKQRQPTPEPTCEPTREPTCEPTREPTCEPPPPSVVEPCATEEASPKAEASVTGSSGSSDVRQAGDALEPLPPSGRSESTISVAGKRQREDKLQAFHARLKEVLESEDLQNFQKRLQKECLVALKQSSWPEDLKGALRAAKRSKQSSDTVDSREVLTEVREPFLRQVPVSIKGQLVSKLRAFFSEQNL